METPRAPQGVEQTTTIDSAALAAIVQEAALAWQRAGLEKRLAVLQEAGQELAARRSTLHEIFLAEGLSRDLARAYAEWIVHAGDAKLLDRYARALAQWLGNGSGGELLTRRGDGVVLVFGQAGSPTFNVAPLFSILLPGNGAIFVRAPILDRGVRFIAEEILQPALQRHGFARQLVAVVTERYREVLSELIASREVKTILSIGSAQDNNSVARQAHEQGKKVILEHYGRGCMVVWRDAPIDKAVDSARRAFDFSAKPCFVPKHFFVHEEIFEPFIAALIARLPDYSKSVEADPEHGVLVPAAQLNGYLAALQEAREVGELRYGGYRMDAHGRRDEAGYYVPPTVVTLEAQDCFNRSLQCIDREIFFPLAPVVRFSGEESKIVEQMAALINRAPVGLRASIWTNRQSVIEFFTKTITDIGLLRFNNDHSESPAYASFWGGGNGDNHLFWEKTSHLQAIDCQHLTREETRVVMTSLGCLRFVPEFNDLPAVATPAPPVAPIVAPVVETVSAGEYDGINLRIEEGVAEVELARPKRHNSINAAMQSSLYRLTEDLIKLSPQLRCVVISGAGRSFCSGADLEDLTGFTPEQAKQFMLKAAWAFRRLEQLSVPVIAAVKGYCMGGGFEMALHCDEIIASDDAVFRFPETGIGIITTTGAVGRLISIVGAMRAKRLLTGEKLSASQAEQIGLVSRVVAGNELTTEIAKRCRELIEQPREGLAAIKKIVGKCQYDIGTTSWIAEIEAFDTLAHGPWQQFVKESLKKS